MEKRAAKKKKVVGKSKVGKSKRRARKKREWKRERKKEKKERECTTYENKRREDRVWSSVFQHSSKIAWQSQHKYFISNSSMFAEQPEPIRPMTIRRQVQKFTIKLFANI